LTHGRRASPGVAGDQVKVAPRIGVGDPAPQHFDRKQNRGQRIVEFMHDVAHFEAEHIGGGGSAEEEGGHGRLERPQHDGASTHPQWPGLPDFR
jgi:hypothetical protein